MKREVEANLDSYFVIFVTKQIRDKLALGIFLAVAN